MEAPLAPGVSARNRSGERRRRPATGVLVPWKGGTAITSLQNELTREMFLVPFDGSYLAESALVRATEYAEALDEDVLAVCIVPEDEAYAREREWLDPGEPFDVKAIVSDVHRQVTDLAPEVSFRYERAADATAETIAEEIKQIAGEVYPSVVFLGSRNAGQIVTPITSVAGNVGADAHYDVHIVRHRSPTPIQRIDEHAEFYEESI